MHAYGRILLGAALLLLLAARTPALAQAPAPDPEERLKLEFTGMDLDRILKLVSDEMGVRFLYDEKILKRKVNLLSPVDIKRKDLMAVLLSILEMQNFTMVKAGPPEAELWKIVPFTAPIANPPNKGIIKTLNIEDIEKELPQGEELASLVVRLKFVDARSAFIAIQGMASDPRMVQAIESANVVVVTDTAQNIRRIARIVQLMDIEKPGPEIEVIQLKYADPKDIVDKLTPLLQVWTTTQGPKIPGQPDFPGGAGDQGRPFLVADQRTQQIIIFATKERIAQLRDLIKNKLDIPVKYAERQTKVHFLRHATAKTLVEELKQVATDIQLQAAQPTAGQPGQPTIPTTPTGGSTAGSSTAPKIVADDANNAIILFADQKTIVVLEEIISALDIRRPQVQIHALIVEASQGLDYRLGIEATTVDDPTKHDLVTFSGTNFGITRVVDLNGDQIPDGRLPVAGLAGLVTGIMKERFSNIPLIVHAFQSDADINVLSQPRLVVNDNTAATFTVKEQVPTTTQSTTGTGIVTTTFSGFQDASLTLKITPHISEKNYLRLEVDQLIEAFRGEGQVINGTQIPPAKASRQVTTTVTVPHDKTVVIGGLAEQREDETTDGVPYLSEIPLLGRLFERTVRNRDRRTVYIFITPTILHDANFEDYLAVSNEAKAQIYDASGNYVGVPETEDNRAGALDSVRFRSPFPCRGEAPSKDPFEGVDRRDYRGPDDRPDPFHWMGGR